MPKILCVVGARPNFMKLAPIYLKLKRDNDFNPVIVHTGQHYDYEMSQVFFEDLELPEPDHFLDVGSGSHAEQTGRIMIEFEKVLLKELPDLVMVFGDVNSTLSCSLAAKKLNIPVAHVEAGLRSFDETMPEEINRRLTDSISDLLFTPSRDGDDNLMKEGISKENTYFVGNIMIDSLVKVLGNIDEMYEKEMLVRHGLSAKEYALVTLHRPSNVDRKENLIRIIDFLGGLSGDLKILFPVHPRTSKNIQAFGLAETAGKIDILEPLRYKEFIVLLKNAKFVLTDSGGIQEETTYLDVPCLTLRNNTERPVTLTQGTNELVDMDNIGGKVKLILEGRWKRTRIPEFWDGGVSGRICSVLNDKWGAGAASISNVCQ